MSEVASAAWETLLELDRRVAWHPYEALPSATPTLPVVSARGVMLRLADGRELIDGMASWWCAIHGYRHPALQRALHDQLDRLPHVMFGGLTHEGAVQLAARLAQWTGQDHVFFADSGSVAVEVAIKMALQATGRRRLLTVRGGYHGDTFGAMALSDPADGMHRLFPGALAKHEFAPRPPAVFDDDWAAAVDGLVDAHADELAAVIVEPIVQGAGGMWFYAPECLRHLREVCDAHGLLLILDEIATGFGRTGKLFGADHAAVRGDIVCVGKALTGGTITLAATLCGAHVAAALDGPLMHGPTYMASPLACAAALASTDLLADGAWRDDVERIERGLRLGLEPARELGEVRVLGAIGVVQLDHPVEMAAATAAALEHGVWLRPFRNLVYAMPPYVADDEHVERIATAMVAAARAA